MSRIKVFFYSCLLLCCSCSSYRFAKDGIFVNDVDEYFNPKEEINVWLYSNFYPYRVMVHQQGSNIFKFLIANLSQR